MSNPLHKTVKVDHFWQTGFAILGWNWFPLVVLDRVLHVVDEIWSRTIGLATLNATSFVHLFDHIFLRRNVRLSCWAPSWDMKKCLQKSKYIHWAFLCISVFCSNGFPICIYYWLKHWHWTGFDVHIHAPWKVLKTCHKNALKYRRKQARPHIMLPVTTWYSLSTNNLLLRLLLFHAEMEYSPLDLDLELYLTLPDINFVLTERMWNRLVLVLLNSIRTLQKYRHHDYETPTTLSAFV